MEGDLDDPWYPRQLGRTEEEEEEEEESGQDERERNKSPESASGGKRKAKRRKPGAESRDAREEEGCENERG